jgi:uncharacterized membrane protein
MTREKLSSFCDGVFAVIITILVLELKVPSHPSFAALYDEWPTALSYGVSYLLIAIMWLNHHFLLRYATDTTRQLMPWTFAHMFMASLVPVATAWLAESRMAAVPVFVYATTILCVNISYHGFAHTVVGRGAVDDSIRSMRHKALTRSFITMGLFALAMIIALRDPLIAFALVTCIVRDLPYTHECVKHWTRQRQQPENIIFRRSADGSRPKRKRSTSDSTI